MSIETQPFDFLVATGQWAFAVTAFLVLLICGASGLSMMTHGIKGPLLVLRWIPRFPADLLQLSSRRVFAIAQLTFREAIRRKALVVFGMFALLFMFGSWFLDNPNERMELQVKNYISFVLTAITWLLLPVVLLLSCWGLPEDIRNRSLHTVVTKPARKTEIVIGRMLGFSTLMTILVVVMGVTGYVWIDREVAFNLTVYSETIDVDGQETLVEFVDEDEGVTVRVTADDEPTQVTAATSRTALRQENPALYALTERARIQALGRHLVAKRPVLGTISFKGDDGKPLTKRALGKQKSSLRGSLLKLGAQIDALESDLGKCVPWKVRAPHADALILAAPGYHGTVSGLVKNALDYLEDLAKDSRPYLHGRSVGLIATAYGDQASMSTLLTMRSIVHALRGWPTPMGATVRTYPGLFSPEGECLDDRARMQLRLVGEQSLNGAKSLQGFPEQM